MTIEIQRVSIVECLIKYGADIKKQNAKGWSPILLGLDKPKIVRLLVNDINRKAGCGETPLTLALSIEKYKYIELLLLELGADPNICSL